MSFRMLVLASALLAVACMQRMPSGDRIIIIDASQPDARDEAAEDLANDPEPADAADDLGPTDISEGGTDGADSGDLADDTGSIVPDADADADVPSGDSGEDLEPRTCTTCHGSGENAAPPLDTQGRSDTGLTTVGAHRAHQRDSLLHRAVLCGDCHQVPGRVDEPGHIDAPPAELTWSRLATADGVDAHFDGDTCFVYCHGVTLSGGELTEPSWTTVDGTQTFCGSCHGIPPTENHIPAPPGTCDRCHAFGGGPENYELHVNGIVEVAGASCDGCHGAPPETGSHLVHVSDVSDPSELEYGDLRVTADFRPDGIDGYMFGCGNCHPADPSKHLDGTVEIELYDPALYVEPPFDPESNPEPDTIKGHNPPTARFEGGTCRDVYCHSTGQASPAFAEVPAWEGGSLDEPRCAQCHDNPPAYESGPAGSATANSHTAINPYGYRYGHFDTMHWFHRNWDQDGNAVPFGSPVTCQSCHFDTVDPANTGDSGFYYLDTTGVIDPSENPDYACDEAGCHTGVAGGAQVGGGAVLTDRHVNGHRDVVFDPRTAIPETVAPDWFPTGSDRPTYPYWMIISSDPSLMPPVGDATLNGSTWSANLASATYDPETKTCSNVACHIDQSYGSCVDPLIWGPPSSGCSCHTNFWCD